MEINEKEDNSGKGKLGRKWRRKGKGVECNLMEGKRGEGRTGTELECSVKW